jgi:glycine cleavage system aminomethyltransferase T
MQLNSVSGIGASDLVAYMCPSPIANLKPRHSTLSVLMNHFGGVIDDLMVTRLGEEKRALFSRSLGRF